jgi:hypothetical protein
MCVDESEVIEAALRLTRRAQHAQRRAHEERFGLGLVVLELGLVRRLVRGAL